MKEINKISKESDISNAAIAAAITALSTRNKNLKNFININITPPQQITQTKSQTTKLPQQITKSTTIQTLTTPKQIEGDYNYIIDYSVEQKNNEGVLDTNCERTRVITDSQNVSLSKEKCEPELKKINKTSEINGVKGNDNNNNKVLIDTSINALSNKTKIPVSQSNKTKIPVSQSNETKIPVSQSNDQKDPLDDLIAASLLALSEKNKLDELITASLLALSPPPTPI